MIDLIVQVLQEISASIAFRLSQALRLSDGRKASLLVQFLVFALVVVPLFVGLIVGTVWLGCWAFTLIFF